MQSAKNELCINNNQKETAMSFVKFVTLTALSIIPSFAFATETKNFARCYGDHHGSYLNLRTITGSEGLAQVLIDVSNDSDDAAVVYEISEVSKNGAALQKKAYSWAIRQAIKAEAAGDFYGFVKVKAVSRATGKTLYLNLQKYTGELRHALVIDGYVEAITCPVENIED